MDRDTEYAVSSGNTNPDTRLRADMASWRLLVLKFVRSYISSYQQSPSYGEIAAHFDSNRTRVKRAIRSLENDGYLNRVPGPRGISLPDDEQAALNRLSGLGWEIDKKDHVIRLTEGGTKKTLLPPPELDYPSNAAGNGSSDEKAQEA